MSETVRVFVGCAKEHRLAFQVLRHSIECRTTARVEVYPLINADAEQAADHWQDDPLYEKYEPIAIPIPQDPKQRAATTFSFTRFLIPELCGFNGRGIYLDSDQIVLADIAEMWNTDFDGADVVKTPGWQSAVMLIDCRVGWRISEIVRDIDAGSKSYVGTMNLKKMGKLRDGLSPFWNYIDRGVDLSDPASFPDRGLAKLIHYTRMDTQPWLRAGHPLAHYWYHELLDAIAAGKIAIGEVRRAIEVGDVRPSLARLIGDVPPYSDKKFVFPDDRARGKGLHR